MNRDTICVQGGYTPGNGELVRMSCGLESAEDLIADIAQALDKV